jgi:hypothetical protein
MADKGNHEKPTPAGGKPLPLKDRPQKPGKHEGKDSDQKGGKGR